MRQVVDDLVDVLERDAEVEADRELHVLLARLDVTAACRSIARRRPPSPACASVAGSKPRACAFSCLS